MKFKAIVMDAYWAFQEQLTQESYDKFKETFIKHYSSDQWEFALAFFLEFGGADLHDFSTN